MGEKKNDRLKTIIHTDPKLSEEMRLEFLTLANKFMEQFSDNLMMTSIELDNLYGFGADTWKDFKMYPPIKKYLDGFVKEMINNNADASLMSGEGARDAISIKKQMASESGDSTYENFVVFRMPEKEERYVPTGDI